MTTQQAARRLGDAEQRMVNDKVRALLSRSEAFGKMPATERAALARRLADVVSYLAEPKGGTTAALATALAGEPDKGGFGQGVRAGTQAYTALTGAVDFPKFVSGLIDGVFNSIVDASIRQMDAYSKLLANVVKSVEQFAKDNFTLNQGRDYLASRYPNSLSVDVESGTPRLVATPNGEETSLAEVKQDLGLEKDIDLSDAESEAELARKAQIEMAKLRQKQLATMVLLGINRIIVTDGLINAKVVIDVKASDTATTQTTASSFDASEEQKRSGSGGGWFSSDFSDNRSRHATLVKSGTEEGSDSRVEAKAKLTGEVRVAFKSDVFPLDKVASQTQIDSIGERAKP
jgi:hypothetical protein